MNPITNTLIALVFVVLALGSTFLMYYLWGFPFDEQRLRSLAPRRLLRVHRLLGYAFALIYVFMMWQMVPRLWTYQVELPARTVAHLVLGMTIGIILVIKIVIVRFFKHLESRLAPALGTALLIATVLLVGLAAPVAIREIRLLQAAREGDAFRPERMARVRDLLPIAGQNDPARIDALASERGLLDGQTVLRTKCTQCHDLRTILARPRTPDGWRRTVRRMAERSTVLNPITNDEQWAVTAYLIAVTPTLQATARLQRQQAQRAEQAREAMEDVGTRGEAAFDPDAARATFERTCSQCHSTDQVRANPPEDAEAARALVARMVGNGLTAPEDTLVVIVRYLTERFARQPNGAP